MHHSAIHISNKHNKLILIQQITNGHLFADLELLKGELYSEITLNELIDEEIRHEHFDVIKGTKNSLQQYSDGEKKNALLAYIIAKKPDYIIILPWNLKEEVIGQLTYIRDWGGKFVVPIPSLQIID